MNYMKICSMHLSITAIFLFSHFVLAQQPSFDLDRIERATVYIMQAQNVGNNLFITCVASGTIVSRNGLILTNAHNTSKSASCPGETLIIAMSIGLNEPPVPKFRAEIAQVNEGLDIALLRITQELDGRLLESDNLALPFVELGDSSAIRLDDTVTVIGYPGIGNDPVMNTRGTINGFVVEPSDLSGISWIKTSAVIPGTMTGAGAYNQNGELIGIPTTAPITGNALTSNCLPIQDTNGDGLVNRNDICIAQGGFINVLRPSNFARTLFRAAALNLVMDSLTAAVQNNLSAGTPTFSRLFFSPSINEAGMPTSVIQNLPAGSNSLYLFFDYDNMTPETVYELRVNINGQPNPDFSLAPVRWSGGKKGIWYIGSNNRPWPNGVYEFILFANGVTLQTARLVIGQPPDNAPTFTDIAFGLLDLRNNPLGNGFVLPTGNVASARFIFRNMVDGIEWTTIWYLNGTEIPNSRNTNPWSDGANGSATTSVESKTGLIPGQYRLELYIADTAGQSPRLAATSDFTIAGAQQGAYPQVFSNVHFAIADTDADAQKATPISNISDHVNVFYALFDWQQIATGTLWTIRWSVDGTPFYEQVIPWNAPESGTNFEMRLSSPSGIPDGTYKIDLLLNNVQLATAQAQVGIGQLPIDQFAQASGVNVEGRILDSTTLQGIPNVTLILISADFSVGEFSAAWDQNQVYATAVTDSEGYFEIDRPLALSTDDNKVAYSALVAADGYLPVSADGLEVDSTTENPLSVTIYLTRD
ncbi:MAG: trypsin-like peptidase domain-containing protein [Chloroflexota bacterium]